MRRNFFHTASSGIRLLLCLLAAAAWAAEPVKDEPADIKTLRAEVRRLAAELLEHRAEFIQWKMEWMSGELQHIQAERQRLINERQVIEREIGELNQASTNGPGAEDDGRKEELNTIQLPAVMARERAAGVRESALASAISGENARMADIQKQLQRLGGQAARPQN